MGTIPNTRGERFLAVDWLRGLCVLVMIECHSLYLLAPGLEAMPLGQNLQQINGLVAPTFLLAAGFALALVMARAMKTPDGVQRRMKRSLWRIAQIFAVSYLIRLTFWPIFTQPIWLVKIDILSCIALGLLSVLAIMRLSMRRPAVAGALMLAIAAGMLLVTPFASGYRGNAVLMAWLNNSTKSPFPLFPWMGYVLLGGAIGCASGTGTSERRNLWIAFGCLLVVSAAGAIFRPGQSLTSVYPPPMESWWIDNACDRLWKISTVALVLLAVEQLVKRRPATQIIFAPLEFFSGNALAAYFFHQSLLFGFLGLQFTQRWHQNTSWREFIWRGSAIIAATAGCCVVWGWLMGAVAALKKEALSVPAVEIPR